MVPRPSTRGYWRDKAVRAAEHVAARVLEECLLDVERRAQQRHDDLLAHLRGWERRSRRDIWTAAEQEAARSTAAFVSEEIGAVTLRVDPHETLRDALRAAPHEGLALEFGVATGTTLGIIAQERSGRHVFGFDSFAGLPHAWRAGYDRGEFAQEPPQVDGAELVVGLFDQTLPAFLAEHPGPVAFVHIDCDLYESTVSVLERIGPRLAAGTIIAFDEYFNFPGWEQYEHRAWREHVDRTGLEFTYGGLTMDDEQLWVRVTDPGQPRA